MKRMTRKLGALFLALVFVGCAFQHHTSQKMSFFGIKNELDGSLSLVSFKSDDTEKLSGQKLPDNGFFVLDLASVVSGGGGPGQACSETIMILLANKIITKVSPTSPKSCIGQESLDAIFLGKTLPVALIAAGQVGYGALLRPARTIISELNQLTGVSGDVNSSSKSEAEGGKGGAGGRGGNGGKSIVEKDAVNVRAEGGDSWSSSMAYSDAKSEIEGNDFSTKVNVTNNDGSKGPSKHCPPDCRPPDNRPSDHKGVKGKMGYFGK